MTAIQVRGLEKSYKQLHVLRGVDFDVERGSIFALLGSNGAGKTTVVRILATLLKPDAGTAAITGFDVVTQADEVRAAISLTGQFAAVDEILSGRENLVLIAKLRRLKHLSSAFVPTATMPGPVRWFAEHQPVTSIVNTIRALFTRAPVGTDIWTALAWCAGILVIAYAFATAAYRRKVT